MTKLVRRFYVHLKRSRLLPYGTRVLVACSGGPDSVALLLLLRELAPMLHFTVMAAHYEHGLRGEASRADAAFVAELCQSQGIACQIGTAPRGSITGASESIETAARRLRYAFLEQARQAAGADVICTAHHADDQAETVLMHLLRGTGLDGLAGIPARDDARHLVRPLLPFRKEELIAYCGEQGITPRHDATNDVPDGLRNRVRLDLLPQIAEDYNPRIREGLCRLAIVAGEERKALDAVAEDAFHRLHDGDRLDAKGMAKLPKAIARRVLRRYLASLGHAQDVSLERAEALFSLLAGESGKTVELPGISITKDHGWLRPVVFLKKKIISKNKK